MSLHINWTALREYPRVALLVILEFELENDTIWKEVYVLTTCSRWEEQCTRWREWQVQASEAQKSFFMVVDVLRTHYQQVWRRLVPRRPPLQLNHLHAAPQVYQVAECPKPAPQR